jgi:dienelactone hydrolase
MQRTIMMRLMRRGRTLAALVVILGLGLAYWAARPYARTVGFLADMSGTTGWWRAWLRGRTQAVTARDLTVPTRGGAIPARLYSPEHPAAVPVAIFPGIHAGGVGEPRLDHLAQTLASSGFTVLTVPLPDLRLFRITPRSTDMLEDAVVWLATNPALAPSGRTGVVGVSFSGGLAVVAAGRPRLEGHVAAVVSIGGHADLPREMRYLCTGVLPDGSVRPPHDYGAAVILLGAASRLVPDYEADPLEHTVSDFLVASSVESTNPAGAVELFAQVRARSARLAEPAQTLMREVNDRNVAALGPRLIPYIDALGSDPALSPDRSPATDAPVFLLHGADDNIIPSTETPLLADYLRAHGNTRVTTLLTPLMSHAGLQPSGRLGDAWALVRFWREVFETSVLP